MKRGGLFTILLIICLSPFDFCMAYEAKPRTLAGIEILGGYGWGKKIHNQNYTPSPLLVDFDFDLKPLLARKFNFDPQQLIQFQVEPFVSIVASGNTNTETGAALFLKIGLLPDTSRLQPYIKAGVGLVYITRHIPLQSTQFNFIDQIAAGIHYYFRKDLGLTLEGRLRHLSNANIKKPNHGLNTYFALLGVTFKF